MIDNLSILYDLSLTALYNELNNKSLDPETAILSADLIAAAKQYDIDKAMISMVMPYAGTVKRNFNQPTTYISPHVLDQPWADNPTQPLKKGEKWNEGKRGTNSGVLFTLDDNGLPLNPYLNYGVRGLGVIGCAGANHAVDLGILDVRENGKGEYALHALGIIRKDSNLPALCGGFTNFVKQPDGSSPYTKQVMVDTQVSEFFEELVSGSIELMPAYAKNLELEIEREIQKREIVEKKPPSPKQASMIREQIITHRKLLQVENEDPYFLNAIRYEFNNARPCYAGPVLSSARNTNNAWMETRLSSFMMDEKKWTTIQAKCKFNYEFKAGDDAGAVLWHEITPELVKVADSHGGLFGFLQASHQMSEKYENKRIQRDLKYQTDTLTRFMIEESETIRQLGCKL